MRVTLKEHQDIKVKQLNQFIPAEGGSERARAIGNQPEHKAAFVIWGDYTLDPEPELYVHFDILLDRVPSDVAAGAYEEYGPGQILQPNMFDFKMELGAYLGELSAFASAVSLYEAGEHYEATSLFDTAAEAVGQRLAARWERLIHFYRGANLQSLGRASEAATDLRVRVPPSEDATSPVDGITLSATISLGLVELDQGNLAEAKALLERALGIFRQRSNRLGEVVSLNNLGLVAFAQSDLPTARNYFEAALVISRQLGSRENEAKNLGNLGLVARNQGDYSKAGIYHTQALMIYRQTHLRMGEASQLGNLALIARNMGDYRTAAGYHTQALVIHRELENTRGEAADLSGLGLVATEQGAYSTAKELHRQALELHRRLRDPLGEAKDLGNLGIVAIREGECSSQAVPGAGASTLPPVGKPARRKYSTRQSWGSGGPATGLCVSQSLP